MGELSGEIISKEQAYALLKELFVAVEEVLNGIPQPILDEERGVDDVRDITAVSPVRESLSQAFRNLQEIERILNLSFVVPNEADNMSIGRIDLGILRDRLSRISQDWNISEELLRSINEIPATTSTAVTLQDGQSGKSVYNVGFSQHEDEDVIEGVFVDWSEKIDTLEKWNEKYKAVMEGGRAMLERGVSDVSIDEVSAILTNIDKLLDAEIFVDGIDQKNVGRINRLRERIENKFASVILGEGIKSSTSETAVSFQEWTENKSLHPEACRESVALVEESRNWLGLPTPVNFVSEANRRIGVLVDMIGEVSAEISFYQNHPRTVDDPKKANFLKARYLAPLEKIEGEIRTKVSEVLKNETTAAIGAEPVEVIGHDRDFLERELEKFDDIINDYSEQIEVLESSDEDVTDEIEELIIRRNEVVEQRRSFERRFWMGFAQEIVDVIARDGLPNNRDDIKNLYDQILICRDNLERVTKYGGDKGEKDRAESLLSSISSYYQALHEEMVKIWKNERIDFIDGEINSENVLIWIRKWCTTFDKSIDHRYGQREQYVGVVNQIEKLKLLHPELGGLAEREFESRRKLHNDFRAHIYDKQMFKFETVDNPDLNTDADEYFFDVMNNTQGIPVAHARRLLLRSYNNMLAGLPAEIENAVNASTFEDYQNEVAETIIRRLADESGVKVSEEQASLAFHIASRHSLIVHERAAREYTMKQKKPDKWRDYFHSFERQVYYRDKARKAATQFATVSVACTPGAFRVFRQAYRDKMGHEIPYEPVIYLPEMAESWSYELREVTKGRGNKRKEIILKPEYAQLNDRIGKINPNYCFIGDFWQQVLTNRNRSAVVFDVYEQRFRYELLIDVVAEEDMVDPIYGYRIAKGESMPERIDWSKVDPIAHEKFINQVGNVKAFNDDFYSKSDVSPGDFKNPSYWEGLRIPTDYTMGNTYYVRDADISLKAIAKSIGCVDGVETVDGIVADPAFGVYIDSNRLDREAVIAGLRKVGLVSSQELQKEIHARILMGLFLHNYSLKKSNDSTAWKPADFKEILETAERAQFIDPEHREWINKNFGLLDRFFREFVSKMEDEATEFASGRRR